MRKEFKAALFLILLVAAVALLSGCADKKNITVKGTTGVIEQEAYRNNDKIETVVIEDGITEIREGAFRNCKNLRSVTIPDSVTVIGPNAFIHCAGLESIVIPAGVKEIGESAFAQCTGLKSVTLPDGLEKIGDCAFQNCGLTSVELPSTVTRIGNQAFAGSLLESVNVPAPVTSAPSAFSGCRSLTKVRFEEGLEMIDGYCFHGCRQLSEIEIPGSVKVIEDNAFKDTGLIASIDILPTDIEALEGMLESAVDARGGKIAESTGSRILPLQVLENFKGEKYYDLAGSLYCRIPEDMRTLDANLADFVLLTVYSDKHSANFIGPAYDTVTAVYLLTKDNPVRLVFTATHAPKQKGFTALAPGISQISGERATGEEIWNILKDLF